MVGMEILALLGLFCCLFSELSLKNNLIQTLEEIFQGVQIIKYLTVRVAQVTPVLLWPKKEKRKTKVEFVQKLSRSHCDSSIGDRP